MARLAVSNLALPVIDKEILSILYLKGVRGIEVAPTKISSWEDLTSQHIRRYKSLLRDNGFLIPSFQSILYGKPHLQLLGNYSSFIELCSHVERVSELALEAGADILVFGAPENRLLLGKELSDAYDLAVERFYYLAEITSKFGVMICLESIPSIYKCEFVRSYKEGLRLVQKVGHSNFMMHIDVGCTILAKDDIEAAVIESRDYLKHFHVSQKNLGDFLTPNYSHILASKALSSVEYNGWLSIEMLLTEKCDINCVYKSIDHVLSIYSNIIDKQ